MKLLNHEEEQALLNAYRTSFADLERLEPRFADAYRWVLYNPGNMVRGKLCLKAAEVCGLSRQLGLRLACAFEYFHLASLILDDLPCMDDASLRRGKRCLHLEFGESTAILAALGLINRSYAMLWAAVAEARTNGISDEASAAAWNGIESCFGVQGVLGGQLSDLAFSGTEGSPEIQRIAINKTGSLFRLVLTLPCILGSGNPLVSILAGRERSELHRLAKLGALIGLAYQLIDDLKDTKSKGGYSGKNPRDAQLNRPNIVRAVGVEEARARLERLIRLLSMGILPLEQRRSGWSFLRSFTNQLSTEAARLNLENAAVDTTIAVYR